jgi:hypothetical protein
VDYTISQLRFIKLPNIQLRKIMRTELFCVITRRVVVISYRRFGTTYRSHLQGSRIRKIAHCPNTRLIYGRPPPFLPSQTQATTLVADTTLPRLFNAHILPYMNSVLDNKLSFGFLTPEDGTERLSRNVGKKLPLITA